MEGLQTGILDINKVIADKDVPKIYANFFSVSHSFTDVSIALQQQAEAQAVLFMSFGTAKVLQTQLNLLLESIENTTGEKISDPAILQAKYAQKSKQ